MSCSSSLSLFDSQVPQIISLPFGPTRQLRLPPPSIVPISPPFPLPCPPPPFPCGGGSTAASAPGLQYALARYCLASAKLLPATNTMRAEELARLHAGRALESRFAETSTNASTVAHAVVAGS